MHALKHLAGLSFLFIFSWILTIGASAENQNSGLEELTKKCNSYWSVDLDSAHYYGLKAVKLAKADRKPSEVAARAYMFLAVVHYYIADYDSAIIYIEDGLKVAEEINSEWGQGFGFNLLTILMRKKGDYAKSIDYAHKTIELREALKDTFNLAGAYNNLATTYSTMGDLEAALENQMISLELRINSLDTIGIAMGHGNIADTYLLMKNIPLAKEHIDRSIQLTEKGSEMYANNLIILGDIFHSNYNEPDTALSLYKEALLAFKNIGITDGVAVAHENVASTLFSLGKMNEALEHLQKSDSLYHIIGDKAQLSHLHLNYAEYYSLKKHYSLAESHVNKALEYAMDIDNSASIQNALEARYILSKQFGKSEQALRYLERFKSYSDSLSTEKVYGKMAMLETRYKTLEKENKIIRLEYKQAQDKRHKQLLYGTIAFIISLVLVIGISVRNRNKKRHEINEQKQKLLLGKQKLVEVELEKQRLKEKDLQDSIVYKSKQLSTHALHMMQRNNLLQDIHDELNKLKASSESKEQVRKIKLLINRSLRSTKDWDVFKRYFEEVNENFYQHLQQLNPELSTTDLKICALIKLNMDSKEMASVLNVVPNSIKSSRYRLKKKLGLDAETDLEEYIRSIH